MTELLSRYERKFVIASESHRQIDCSGRASVKILSHFRNSPRFFSNEGQTETGRQKEKSRKRDYLRSYSHLVDVDHTENRPKKIRI